MWATIVGVVGEIREQELGVPPQPTAYLSATSIRIGGASTETSWPARHSTRQDPRGADSHLHQYESTVTPSVADSNKSVSLSVLAPRVRALVLAAFAALALVLASIGVDGVTAHITARRTAEIGIRMALGAACQQLLIAVASRVVSYTAGGMVIGLVLALAVGAAHPRPFIWHGTNGSRGLRACGKLASLIAMFAACILARRATLIDPTEALRAESLPKPFFREWRFTRDRGPTRPFIAAISARYHHRQMASRPEPYRERDSH